MNATDAVERPGLDMDWLRSDTPKADYCVVNSYFPPCGSAGPQAEKPCQEEHKVHGKKNKSGAGPFWGETPPIRQGDDCHECAFWPASAASHGAAEHPSFESQLGDDGLRCGQGGPQAPSGEPTKISTPLAWDARPASLLIPTLNLVMAAMIDPVYASSGPGAVLHGLTICSQALQQLQHLQREYHSAPATLEALSSEANHVARLLSILNGLFYDPEKNVAGALELNMELRSAFDRTMRPCRVVFSSLEQEMRRVFLPAYDSDNRVDDMKSRARYLFTENVLKNYLSLVRTLRSALSLLNSAMQIRSRDEIGNLLQITEPILADLEERTLSLQGPRQSVYSVNGLNVNKKDDGYHATSPQMSTESRQSTYDPSESMEPQQRTQPSDILGPAYGSLYAKTPRTRSASSSSSASHTAGHDDMKFLVISSPDSGGSRLDSITLPDSSIPVSQSTGHIRRASDSSSRFDDQSADSMIHAISPTNDFRRKPINPPDMSSSDPMISSIPEEDEAIVVPDSAEALSFSHGPPVPKRNIERLSSTSSSTSGGSVSNRARTTNTSPTAATKPTASYSFPLPLRNPPVRPLPHPRPQSTQEDPQDSKSMMPPPLSPQTATRHPVIQPEIIQPSAMSRAGSPASVPIMSRQTSTSSRADSNAIYAISANTSSSAMSRANTGSPATTYSDTHSLAWGSGPAPSTTTPVQHTKYSQGVELLPSDAAQMPMSPQSQYSGTSASETPISPSLARESLVMGADLERAESITGQSVASQSVSSHTLASESVPQRSSSHQTTSIQPASVRSNSNVTQSSVRSSEVTRASGQSTLDAEPVQLDFRSIIPQLINRGPAISPRPDEVEGELLRDKDMVLVATDMNVRLGWAEDVLRHTSINSQFLKRVARAKSRKGSVIAQDQLQLDARNIVEELIHAGNPRAFFLKARWFELDPSQVQELYLTALSKGYLRAAFYLGRRYESKKENATAFEYYRKGASGHDSACSYRMAKIYLKGELDRKKDHKAAIPLLQQSALSSDKDAPYGLFMLGMLQTKAYQKSVGLNKKLLAINEIAARNSITHAATLGLAAAQLKLGLAYTKPDNDISLANDTRLAMHYLGLASRQGEAEADLELSNCFWWGHQGVCEVDEKLAYLFARMAAEDSLTAAFCQVGFFHERGIGVPINLGDARTWYLRGASLGDRAATNRLDALRRSGRTLGFSS